MTKYTPHPEEVALQIIKNKDKQAFDFMYRRYGPCLYGLIDKMLPDKSMRNDVFVMVMVKIWNDLDNYNADKCRFYTWINQVAQKKISEYLSSGQH